MNRWGPPEVSSSAFGRDEVSKGVWGNVTRAAGKVAGRGRTGAEPPRAASATAVRTSSNNNLLMGPSAGKPAAAAGAKPNPNSNLLIGSGAGKKPPRTDSNLLIGPGAGKPAAATRPKDKKKGWSNRAKLGAGLGGAGVLGGGGYYAASR